MMPFANNEIYQSDNVFDALNECLAKIDPAISDRIKLLRGDSIFSTENILSRIWQMINDCGILVADLTTKNPNVLYEIGLCHASGRDVILISNSPDDIPIDLQVGTTYFVYDDLTQLAEKFPEVLDQYLKDNQKALNVVSILANQIHQYPDLFFELVDFCGKNISSHPGKSKLKNQYVKNKFSIALSDFYFVQRGLFILEDLNEYGSGILKITTLGEAVKEKLEAEGK